MARWLWLLATLAFAAGLGPAGAAQTTWTVDDNGGADFVHIQDAVNAASDGDVIVVWGGAYAAFAIDGKSLVVAGQPGPHVRVAGRVVVRNVGIGQKVELENLHIGVTFSTEPFPLLIEGNPGSVRIVDCEIQGWWSQSWEYSMGTVTCRSSNEVGLLRSTVRTTYALYYWGGIPGLRASLSNLIITDSWLVGGDGYSGLCEASPGGPGALLVDSSTIVTFGSMFDGGPGGYTPCVGFPVCGGCWPPGPHTDPPGPGIALGTGSTGEWKASTFNGAPGPQTGPFAHTEIAASCFGTWDECPCGNNGAAGAGCETFYNSGGVRLSASGNPSVAGDTVTLQATGFNPGASPPGVFFQGDAWVAGGLGAPFTDGLLCAGGTIRRLKGRSAVAGTMAFGYGVGNDAPVSVRGALPAQGGTRTYQVWYRHQSASYCTPDRHNMSSGLEISWQP